MKIAMKLLQFIPVEIFLLFQFNLNFFLLKILHAIRSSFYLIKLSLHIDIVALPIDPRRKWWLLGFIQQTRKPRDRENFRPTKKKSYDFPFFESVYGGCQWVGVRAFDGLNPIETHTNANFNKKNTSQIRLFAVILFHRLSFVWHRNAKT